MTGQKISSKIWLQPSVHLNCPVAEIETLINPVVLLFVSVVVRILLCPAATAPKEREEGENDNPDDTGVSVFPGISFGGAPPGTAGPVPEGCPVVPPDEGVPWGAGGVEGAGAAPIRCPVIFIKESPVFS